jgi:hypothetical protein
VARPFAVEEGPRSLTCETDHGKTRNQRFAVKTERDVRQAPDAGDTIPEQANVYVPPRPLAALSEHRTMDVKAIRLAAEVDPRQALTELKLVAPPLRPHREWLVPVALAVLAVGFICLWWVMPTPISEPIPVSPRTVEPRVPTTAPLAVTPGTATAAPSSSETVALPATNEIPTSSSTFGAPTAPPAKGTAPLAPSGKASRRAKPPAHDPWLE